MSARRRSAGGGGHVRGRTADDGRGDAFELVATRSGPQLYLLAADDRGRIYAGNNTTTARVQVLVPHSMK